MSAPCRRIIRPENRSPIPDVHRQRQVHKLRTRLEKERHTLSRWITRLRRSFHAVEKVQQTIARLEKQIARLEE